MESFGQRIGRRPLNDVIQTDSVDPNTRVAMWNLMHGVMENLLGEPHPKATPFLKTLWADVMHRPIDEYYWQTCTVKVKGQVLKTDWIESLEMVEGFGAALDSILGSKFGDRFRKIVNEELAKGLIGYRFIGSKLAAVDDDQSAAEVVAAMASASDAARSHLDKAVSLLADKHNPQYGKVAGEAVMAVEASVHNLTGKKTLGDGVRELEKRGLPVHPAIVKAWSAMYGYTSDAGGIRHANIGGEEVDAAMAVYLLVTCSAFVNLLSKVASRAEE